MEPHELVVAETDLRAAEAEVEWGLTAENHRTRLASLMSRPIETRMKIDDCWIAHTRPR